jgi:hypothetical protein
VDGELALPTRMEASRRRYGDVIAATRAARAVFMATAPHRGSARGGLTGPALRLACAQPGDQISIFGDALRELSERAAYLYREGDRYWFSTQPTLNRIADERATDLTDDDADAEIAPILRKEQGSRGGFHRVHGAPDNPLDVEDARSIALVMLPPAYCHAARADGPTSARDIVIDTLQRRGPGQRRFRNTLVFVAADESGLDSCREIARKFIAWRSIVNDEGISANLTRAQLEDAQSRMNQSAEGLTQRIRSTWSHVLYPGQSTDGGNGSGPATGFDIEHSSVVNRAPGKPIPQVVYDKLRANGVIVDELGPDTFMAELRKIWEETTPHVPVATLLDWFASYVYLPRLRDDVTVTTAIEKLVAKIDSPVAFAVRYDEQTHQYSGVSKWSIGLSDISSGLLVWRQALPTEAATPEGQREDETDGQISGAAPGSVDGGQRRPRRFFGSITLNPDNPGLQVAKIAEEILFELTRPRGAELRLTLEIEGSADDGYPDDVVDVVRSNLRDLKIDMGEVGFEEE